jgi:radical SAM superfamily enzyme YgiQ (UPF0313 family)
MLSMGIESASDDIRKDMLKRLEREKIHVAFANLREAGIKSFAFFIYGYPGDTLASMERTTEYALELDPDFANFYPAVPYPGTELYEKVRRDGLLPVEDWNRMEYSYYLLDGNGIDADTVMNAIKRARRKFLLRPGYLSRHVIDIIRLGLTKPSLAWHMTARTFLGERVPDIGSPGGPIVSQTAPTA